jgi:hypothetical protein
MYFLNKKRELKFYENFEMDKRLVVFICLVLLVFSIILIVNIDKRLEKKRSAKMEITAVRNTCHTI